MQCPVSGAANSHAALSRDLLLLFTRGIKEHMFSQKKDISVIILFTFMLFVHVVLCGAQVNEFLKNKTNVTPSFHILNPLNYMLLFSKE